MGIYKLTPDAEADLHRIWLRGVREYGEAQADKYGSVALMGKF